jgi:hypothetical protein
MNNADCYTGSGCTVDLINGGAQACWTLGGVINGSTSCSVYAVGFCQGINQTAYTMLANELHYNVTCKTSGGSKPNTRNLLVWLGLLSSIAYVGLA